MDPFTPAYLRTLEAGGLDAKVAAAQAELAECRACPRECGVDRLADETGVCHTGRLAVVSSAFPHLGEEDCLRGRRGSGTIFFGFCNLRCVFCQNWNIAQSPAGTPLAAEDVAGLMLDLQERGCHNINLVTPEHVAPQVAEAVAIAARRGLRIPLVYNTSAYDALASLKLMDGLIDIYLPDFKFWEPDTARRLARAADYPERAREAITEMHRQVGDLDIDGSGLARHGVLVRHLVMPGLLAESRAIFEWLAEEISPDTFVNIMSQYRPAYRVPGSERFADIDRRAGPEEIAAAHQIAREAGLRRFDSRT